MATKKPAKTQNRRSPHRQTHRRDTTTRTSASSSPRARKPGWRPTTPWCRRSAPRLSVEPRHYARPGSRTLLDAQVRRGDDETRLKIDIRSALPPRTRRARINDPSALQKSQRATRRQNDMFVNGTFGNLLGALTSWTSRSITTSRRKTGAIA